ncbi:hypothetical protein ALP30_05018, partial [Pseudomonas syringae pv. primulae]
MVGMHFVTLCVTQRFCDVSDVCSRLKEPFRRSATDFEGSNQAKSQRRFRPDFAVKKALSFNYRA